MSDESPFISDLNPSTKEVFDNFLSCFPIVFIQWDGVIKELNSKAIILLGYEPDEAIDHHIQNYLQYIGIPLDSFGSNIVFESLVSRSDSSVFPAQIYAIPFAENSSALIIHDLSSRNRLREQLIQEKHVLETVIEAMHDQVFLIDSEHRYLLNNKAHLQFLGAKNQEEVLGKKTSDFFKKEQAQIFVNDNQLILSNSVPVSVRTEEVRPGEWYEIKKTALKDPTTDKIIGVVGLTRNVTERLKTEEKLRHVQRLDSIGLLAGGIAHDFNNLLTVVVGLSDTASLTLEALQYGEPIQKETIQDLKETLNEIREAGQRAAGLTQKLLAVGRRQIVEMKPISLNDIIREMNSVLVGILKAVDNPLLIPRLDHSLAVDLPLIFADRSQLEQVLMNLIGNARDAIIKRKENEGELRVIPHIILKTYQDLDSKRVILKVEDNGCGMSEEVKSHIFDPFFTTKEIGRGTGLGLASVYGILQQFQAGVQINSEVGVGTTFQISFIPWNTSIHGSSHSSIVSHSRNKNRKILYAEDDSVIRVLVKRNLQMKGYVVVEAENGEIASKIYEANPHDFSLVLTDLMMPIVSGIELIARVQQINLNQKILCVSGYSNEDTRGLPILNKPFTIQKLFQKVEEIIQ